MTHLDGRAVEFEQWLPALNVVMYSGNQVRSSRTNKSTGQQTNCASSSSAQRARDVIREKEFFLAKGRCDQLSGVAVSPLIALRLASGWVHKFNVLLTTYEMVLKDQVSGVVSRARPMASMTGARPARVGEAALGVRRRGRGSSPEEH